MEFQEKYKVDIALFDSTGSTTEQVSPYFDMLGTRRIDFLVEGRLLPTAANSTEAQTLTCRLLSATDSTGGGSTGISSATAIVGKKSTGVVVGSTDKANELLIQFTTLASAATFSIGGYQWSFDSTADATARVLNSTGATADASVAAEAFATAFNSTSNNPIATAWVASTIASALIRISPRVPTNQATFITATGSTLVNIGPGKFTGHIGLEAQHLSDGKRYVAIAVQSSNTAIPFVVTAIREGSDLPVNNLVIQASKTLGGSTSK